MGGSDTPPRCWLPPLRERQNPTMSSIWSRSDNRLGKTAGERSTITITITSRSRSRNAAGFLAVSNREREGTLGGPERKLERGGGEAALLADELRDLERGLPSVPDRTPRTWSEGHLSRPTHPNSPAHASIR
jgi:hypothetical protein